VYYNYHGQATQLIKEGHLTGYVFLENYNGIAPCMLLHFDNHRPMPIRAHRFAAYQGLIKLYYPDMQQTDDANNK
jgi:hypothetical protein